MTSEPDTFSPFSDAVMAALASRSHEWIEWQIQEIDETRHEFSADDARPPHQRKQVNLSVLLAGSTPDKVRAADLCADPAADSPSLSVSELLAQAVETPAFGFPDWRHGSPRIGYALEPDLLIMPQAFIARFRAEILKNPPREAWAGAAAVRQLRVRNSKGYVASFTETEVSLRAGATVIYAFPNLNPAELAKRLRVLSPGDR